MNYFDPQEPPEYPACPICGETQYDILFFNSEDEIVGCSSCVYTKDADEYWEEQDEIAKDAYEDMLFEQMRDQQYEEQYERSKADA